VPAAVKCLNLVVVVPVRLLSVMLWPVLFISLKSLPSSAPIIELIVNDALGPDLMTTVLTSPKLTSELLFASDVESGCVEYNFADVDGV
jgi:hypothetical protein